MGDYGDVAVEADGLRLTFDAPGGGLVGVGVKPEGLSMRVNKGEIFGVIGPDGAGKTTLFRILCSLMLPQSGVAQVAGYDVVEGIRRCVKWWGICLVPFRSTPTLQWRKISISLPPYLILLWRRITTK